MNATEHEPDLTGPGSPLYQVLSDAAMLYVAMPTLVFVVTSAGGGQGVDDHDRVAKTSARKDVRFGDMMGRLFDTADMVVGQVFAGDERPVVAHAIHELHRHVEGKLQDGSRYHAWNKDLWAWTWAGIVKPIMDTYGALRGYPSEAFRQDVYTGFLQLGAGFRVQGLPPRYADFEIYWRQTWLPAMQDQTQAARFIVKLVQTPPMPANAPWLPRPAWQAMTWPLRHLLWTGMLLVTPPEMERMLGIERTRGDRVSLALHHALWRRVPRVISARVTERFFLLRFRYGSPPWRRHYSPESLEQRRIAVKKAKAGASPLPERPSAPTRTPGVHATR
ncbi:MAG: oxygenase MpaB family protein [Panacagrimonas sp.]